MKMRLLLLALLAVTPALLAADREPAPRFSARTTSGESFNNASVKGKVVLLQFWATWCPYCQGEQRIVDSLQKEFAENGLIVLAVNVGESRKTVKHYLQDSPRSCRIVLNEDTNLAAMYAATRYPIYVVIDRDGNIVDEQRGAAGEQALRLMLFHAGLDHADTQASEAPSKAPATSFRP